MTNKRAKLQLQTSKEEQSFKILILEQTFTVKRNVQNSCSKCHAIFFLFKQDETYKGDEDNFIHIYVLKKKVA